MSAFESLTNKQRINASIHRDVKAICTETCHFLGMDITKPAIEIIAELLIKKLSIYGTDLEAFAKHAKRSTINSEDVKLLVRRNPSLKNHINSLCTTSTSSKDKRRKTVSGQVFRKLEITNIQKPIEVVAEKTDEKIEIVEKNDKEESMVIDDTIDLTFD